MASTAHLNFKGHHPKVRPYNSHNNCGGSIKAVKRLLLQALRSCKSDEELFETMVVEMGSSDSGMWYVDTSGCGMLQANDAEPPPKQGWLHKAVQCAAVFLLGLMLLTGPSCKKDPQPSPTPNTPTDTITPVNPGDTITPVNPGDTITPVIPGDTIPDVPGSDTIVPGPGGDTIVPPAPGGDTLPPMLGGTKEYLVDFYPSAGGPVYPSLDSVREWVMLYDTVRIKVRATSDAWTPSGFHVARDSLSPRFDVSPKVYGKGWWVTYQILDDDQLGNISVMGMIRSDSAYFASKGYGIYPQVTGKKPQQPPRYNGNRIQRAGRSH